MIYSTFASDEKECNQALRGLTRIACHFNGWCVQPRGKRAFRYATPTTPYFLPISSLCSHALVAYLKARMSHRTKNQPLKRLATFV